MLVENHLALQILFGFIQLLFQLLNLCLHLIFTKLLLLGGSFRVYLLNLKSLLQVQLWHDRLAFLHLNPIVGLVQVRKDFFYLRSLCWKWRRNR